MPLVFPARAVANATRLIRDTSLPLLAVRSQQLSPLACTRIHFSFPANGDDLQALDLNSDEELTYNNGTAVKVAFQVGHRLCNK